MKKRYTIVEIAKELGLSIATVSRAVNPSTRSSVKEETLRKVLDFVEKVDYVPNQPARRLVTGKSNNIVIFFRPEFKSVFYNDYYSKMIAGAMSAIESTSYNLLISLIKDTKQGFDLTQAVRELDVAGVILCNFMGVTNVSAKNIFNMDVPVIVINQYTKEKNPNCFLIDNFMGSYEATKYLINRGHKRIGFIKGTPGVKDGSDRLEGYKQALKDNKIKFEEVLCFDGDFVEKSGKAAAHYYFGGKIKPPTAVFTANDVMAIGFMAELCLFNKRCPEDVSIIGFDGIDTCKYTNPPLTSVRQPIYEMASHAVKEIINILDKGTEWSGTKYFKTKIIERKSVKDLS